MVMEMSKTYQYRKVMKPLLERKRRARINKCLDDLKDLMVECLQQEGEHVTRLEKADILELTVEHMRKLKQRGTLSLQSQSSAHVESFRSGYVHAADQISQVLLQQRQSDEIGGKIMKFLSTRLIDMQQQLLRSSSATTVTVLPVQVPSVNVNYNTAAAAATTTQPASSPSAALDFCAASIMRYKQYAVKDDLIDVITVDNSSFADTASVTSSVDDSTTSEPVWRPW